MNTDEPAPREDGASTPMSAAAGSSPDQGEVLFYTRPGCPVSALLRCRLRSQRIAVREIDIWADRQAAEVVRAASGGHETVPTPAVGRRTMVSPTVSEVRAAIAAHAPRPVVALVVLAVWVGLAFGSPTTTYHLAPAVLAAAWPVGARWLTGKPPPAGLAAGCAGPAWPWRWARS